MKFDKTTFIIIASVVAVILMLVVGINSVPAGAISYEEKVTEAYSAIKAQEKRRADLLPNLADCVKSSDKHEYETIVDSINARKASDGTLTDADAKEIKADIDFVVERYPQITTQPNYEKFMKELANTENLILESRTAYNRAVSRYNEYTKNPIKKFFLSLTGYERIEFQKLNYDVSEDAPTNLFD